MAAALLGVLLVVFAARSCPAASSAEPCPGAAVNRAVVITLAAATIGFAVAPLAFLAEYAARRRIVYRGSWLRAARRGALAAGVVAVLAGLRLGGVLTAALAGGVILAPIALEAYVTRNELGGGPAG